MSTTQELVERLKAPANWLRQDRGEHWKSVSNIYDRAPFEAAARLDELERENARMRAQFTLLMNRPEIIGASIDGLWEFARAALAGSGEK